MGEGLKGDERRANSKNTIGREQLEANGGAEEAGAQGKGNW